MIVESFSRPCKLLFLDRRVKRNILACAAISLAEFTLKLAQPVTY